MNRIRHEVAELNPGYAALVMATGIISTGFFLFGWRLLSAVLLAVALVAFLVLLVAYVWRLVAFPRQVLTDARDPGRGFGFFTLVAAPNVLGMRLALEHHLLAAAVLGLLSVPVWLVLTYAIPGALIVGHRQQPVLPRINGSWSCGWWARSHWPARPRPSPRPRPDSPLRSPRWRWRSGASAWCCT